MKIKKNDKVIVIAGKDKGKTGTVESVFPKESKAIVSGINMVKRHRRARRSSAKSAIVDIAAPLHVSNLKLAK